MTFLLAEDPEASLAERETLILLWRPRSLVTHIAMGHTCVCVFFFEGGGDPEKSQLETRERIADGEPLDEEFEE